MLPKSVLLTLPIGSICVVFTRLPVAEGFSACWRSAHCAWQLGPHARFDLLALDALAQPPGSCRSLDHILLLFASAHVCPYAAELAGLQFHPDMQDLRCKTLKRRCKIVRDGRSKLREVCCPAT